VQHEAEAPAGNIDGVALRGFGGPVL
jgi:hypothetical protein